MRIVSSDNIIQTNNDSYDMKEFFKIDGEFKSGKMTVVTINPGNRVPLEGFSCHEEDEYSIFVEGEIYVESGDSKGVMKKGEGSLIPKGEKHWCENKTKEPCVLVCLLVK